MTEVYGADTELSRFGTQADSEVRQCTASDSSGNREGFLFCLLRAAHLTLISLLPCPLSSARRLLLYNCGDAFKVVRVAQVMETSRDQKQERKGGK